MSHSIHRMKDFTMGVRFKAVRASRPIIGTLAAVSLGMIFLVSAWGKGSDLAAFRQQISIEGLDFIFPREIVALIALFLEASLGLALVLGARKLWVLLPTALLVLFFIFLSSRNFWLVAHGLRDDASSCGCFGNLITRTPAQAFWQDLLLAPALLLAFWGRSFPFRLRLGARLAVAGVAMGTAAAFVWSISRPPLDHAPTAGEQAAASGTLRHFVQTGDYRLLVEGMEVPGAKVYRSDESGVFLIIRAPDASSSPVLVLPRFSAVQTVDSESLLRTGADGRIELPANIRRESAGQFQLLQDGLTFTIHGRQIQMQNKPRGDK